MLDIISNGVLENRNINRHEVPTALSGLKIATSSMNKVKPFLDRFSEILDLDDQNLNTNGSAIDLLSCKCVSNRIRFALIYTHSLSFSIENWSYCW